RRRQGQGPAGTGGPRRPAAAGRRATGRLFRSHLPALLRRADARRRRRARVRGRRGGRGQDERALPGWGHDRLCRHDREAGLHHRQPELRRLLRLRRLLQLSRPQRLSRPAPAAASLLCERRGRGVSDRAATQPCPTVRLPAAPVTRRETSVFRTRLAGSVLAALTCAALVAGCSSDDPAEDPSSPAGASEGAGEDTGEDAADQGDDGQDTAGDGPEPGTELPEASGAFGDAPEFTFPDSGPPADLQVEVLSEGDGPMVEPGAAVLADYAGIVWGEQDTFDDSYSRGAASLFSLSGVLPGWTAGIPEHPVGSRLLICIPPELGYGPNGGQPDAGIGAEDTIVFVVDLVQTYNPDQAGQADASLTTEAADLPVQVDGELGEPATVTVAGDAAEPAEVEVITIAEGSGDPVAAGQSVAA